MMIPTQLIEQNDAFMISNDHHTANTDPVYLETCKKGTLLQKSKLLQKYLVECSLCPRRCGSERLNGETGICGAGRFPVVSSYGPHYGEEPPLVGTRGSGTVFFAFCNLLCIFCQNYDISHLGQGTKSSISQLADILIEVQSMDCHNLNLVTPTHFLPQIIEALQLAIQRGFSLPIVYNCGGYENIEIIRLLDGIVDIYMPDIKFLDPERSKRYLKAEDYPDVVKPVISEMHRQVGPLRIDNRGIARKGLLVRHLVMPGTSVKELIDIFQFLAGLTKDTYVNIMAQYRPLYKARKFGEIDRSISLEEFNTARQIARDQGLHRGFH